MEILLKRAPDPLLLPAPNRNPSCRRQTFPSSPHRRPPSLPQQPPLLPSSSGGSVGQSPRGDGNGGASSPGRRQTHFHLDLVAWGGEISTRGGSAVTYVWDLALASGGSVVHADGSTRIARGPPRLRRSCGARSMAARGVAAPNNSGRLASWWCR
jgi:hypothetical protein